MIKITLDRECLHNLDLSPVKTIMDRIFEEGAIASYEQQIHLEFDYFRDPTDPRELSEIPEIRLWFLRLDAVYPWIPFFLDWKAGELARYAAMLVPHQFSRNEGIQFNPEALEIFVMQKTFVLADWLKQQEIPSQSRLSAIAQMFGYEFDDSFFKLLQ
ncbi:MAG: CRR6 family NdhI maturation factor [Hydrococcus sp. Prado102]|jgi:hypothetical protein|nr:CRR6 family NdhI maturation factor [Hydrococcus sp. Prado102]